MNSLLGRFRIAAAALCGIALALTACNAVEDVREAPSTPVPVQQGVITGKINGLGYRRPVVLEDQGGKRCKDAGGVAIYCSQSFFGNFDQDVSQFSFGSVPVGTEYNVVVKSSPFGWNCVPAAGASGTVAADVSTGITINCATDLGVTRYCVGGSFASQAIHDIPGLKITLTTEEGTQEKLATDLAVGQDNCWFPNAIFNSGSSLPIFRWYVKATFPTQITNDDGSTATLINNCRVTGGTVTVPTGNTLPVSFTAALNSGTNDLGDISAVPTGNVTNLSIAACDFTIGGNIAYTVPPATGAPGATFQTINGLVLGLRDTNGNLAKDKAGNTVSYAVPAYTPTSATSSTTWAFGAAANGAATGAYRFASNPNALYDVVVLTQPTGQFCLAAGPVSVSVAGANFGTASLNTGAIAQLVNVVAPASFVRMGNVTTPFTFNDITNLIVRCRAVPNPAGAATLNASTALSGTYQMTSTVTNLSVSPITVTTTRNRNFLTFFSDGSFLYGSRAGGTGVERGYYAYNAAAGKVAFTVYTDTNNTLSFTTGASALTTTAAGISALTLDPTTAGAPSLINVAKASPSRITGRATTSATSTTDWQLDEPPSVAGEMEGAWVTDDHRRVWVYDDNTTFGFHVGVNGAASEQDGCYFLYEPSGKPNFHVQEGYYSRRGTSTNGGGNSSGGSETSTGCPIGSTQPSPTTGVASLDSYWPALSVIPKYLGRMPGTQSGFDGRSPSPAPFTITAGNPDSLTVTATSNGVPVAGTTVTLLRNRAN